MSEIDKQVEASEDDCYTFNTTIRLTYNYVYLDYETIPMHSYFRFRTVNIPQGATITAAYWEGRSYSDIAGSSNLRIVGIDEDNTAIFSTQADADGRVATSAYVDWSPGVWTRYGWYGSDQEIKAIIQEIVDRPGWATNNALAIKIYNLDTTRSLTVDSFDFGQGTGAKLHIEYIPLAAVRSFGFITG